MNTMRDYHEEFERRGFLGPFPVISAEEVDALRRGLLGESARFAGSNPYPAGNTVLLDQYLYLPSIMRLALNPNIVDRVKAALGDDVLCWRTSWFRKSPGDPGSDWHQAERFHEFSGVPKLIPTQPRDPFVVTAWIAFTPCTRENGCLQIVPGSHKKWFYDETRPVEFRNEDPKVKDGEPRTFYGYDTDAGKIDSTWSPSPDDVVDLIMEPGQSIVFTGRCLHGSRPNSSKSSLRLALAIRYCAADVKVYDGVDRYSFFGETFPTDRHRCLLVAGRPVYTGNRVIDPGQLEAELAATTHVTV